MASLLTFVGENHSAPYIFSALILIAAMFFAIRYAVGMRRLIRQLLGLEAAIKSLPPSASPNALLACADQSGNSALAARFASWTQTLVRMKDGERVYYLSSLPPAQVIDANVISTSNQNIRFYQAVPNYLIGAGLFFTFLGLTAALIFAASGAISSDVTVAQRSLNKLLGAATFKFMTSLVGLACSIVFGVFEKIEYRKLERAFDQLFETLDEKYPHVSLQQLLEIQQRPTSIRREARIAMVENLAIVNESLESSVGLALIGQNIARTREEAEEQTALLKTFNTDLAASISKAINESLTPQLTSTFGMLQERIDQIGQALNSTNSEALKSIITEFSSQFQQQAKSSFDQMMEAVNALTANIGEHSVRFARSFEGVQEVVQTMRIEGDKASQNAKTLIEQFTITVTRLEGLSELLQTASEPLSRASEAAQGVMERVYETQTGATEMVGRLETVAASFTGIDEDLSAAFSTMHAGFSTVIDDLRKFVVDLDGSFSKALGGVHEVTGSLDSGVEDLIGGLETFESGLGKFNAQVDRLLAGLESHTAAAPDNGTLAVGQQS